MSNLEPQRHFQILNHELVTIFGERLQSTSDLPGSHGQDESFTLEERPTSMKDKHEPVVEVVMSESCDHFITTRLRALTSSSQLVSTQCHRPPFMSSPLMNSPITNSQIARVLQGVRVRVRVPVRSCLTCRQPLAVSPSSCSSCSLGRPRWLPWRLTTRRTTQPTR